MNTCVLHKESSSYAASIETGEKDSRHRGAAQRWYRKRKLRPHAKTNMTSVCVAPTSVKTFDVGKLQKLQDRRQTHLWWELRLTLPVFWLGECKTCSATGFDSSEACVRRDTQGRLTHRWAKAALARPGRQQMTWSLWTGSSAGGAWSHLHVKMDTWKCRTGTPELHMLYAC